METSNQNILATGRIGKLILKLALWVAQIFPRALIGIFGAANESVYYTGFAVRSFRVSLSMPVLACLNKATFIFSAGHWKGARLHGALHGARSRVRRGFCPGVAPFLRP